MRIVVALLLLIPMLLASDAEARPLRKMQECIANTLNRKIRSVPAPERLSERQIVGRGRVYEASEPIPDPVGGTYQIIRPIDQQAEFYTRLSNSIRRNRAFSKKLGFELNPDGTIRLPSVDAINARIDILREAGDPDAPVIKFVANFSPGEIPRREFAAHIVNDEIPLNYNSMWEHDFGGHALSYLAMSDTLYKAVKPRLNLALKVLQDKKLNKIDSVREWAETIIDDTLVRFDMASASISRVLGGVEKDFIGIRTLNTSQFPPPRDLGFINRFRVRYLISEHESAPLTEEQVQNIIRRARGFQD